MDKQQDKSNEAQCIWIKKRKIFQTMTIGTARLSCHSKCRVSQKKHAKVCLFDISEFNNVKSSFEVILCRPNEVAFKIKELIL